MDVTHACRCCLRRAPDKDLATPYTHLGMTEIYADMIKGCFDINLVVGGSGSCGICSACVGRLRDASHFKLQVERSQAELQACMQAASVKEEESAVESNNSEMHNGDGTSEPVSGEKPSVKPDMADEDREPDDILREEPPVKPDMVDEDGIHNDIFHEELIIKKEIAAVDETIDEMSLEERAVKSEVSDAASDEDCVSVCSEGSAAHAREQLAMDCFVVLERLRDATVHSGVETYDCERCCGKHLRNKYISRKRRQKRHLSTGLKKTTRSTFQTQSLVLNSEKSEHECTNYKFYV